MKKLHIDLNISAERYVALYSGAAKDVYAVSREGISVRFPGRNLNAFVTHQGIYGTFAIHFNNQHKLVKIEKIV